MNSRSHTCDRCGGPHLIHIPEGKVSSYYGVTYVVGHPYICIACEISLTPYQYTLNGGPFTIPDILWHVPVGWHATVLDALEQLGVLGWHRMLNYAIGLTDGGELVLSRAVPPWALDFSVGLKAHLVMLKAEQACFSLCCTCGKFPPLPLRNEQQCGPCYAQVTRELFCGGPLHF